MFEKMSLLRPGAIIGVAALAAACGDDPVGVAIEDISSADAAFLAVQVSGLAGGAVDQEAAMLSEEAASAGSGIVADHVPIGLIRARSCPAGGSIQIQGEFSISIEGETKEMTFAASKTLDDCSFQRGEEVFILNGEVAISGTRTKVGGELSGPQETHIEGVVTITVQSTGREETCEIDITSVFDPATGTREVTGTVCGHEVSRVEASDR